MERSSFGRFSIMDALEKGIEFVFANRVGGNVEEGNMAHEEEKENLSSGEKETCRKKNSTYATQKKRVYFFTLSLAFLSFLILLVDMLFKFTTELTKNDELWVFLESLAESKNRSKICNICPSIPKYCPP